MYIHIPETQFDPFLPPFIFSPSTDLSVHVARKRRYHPDKNGHHKLWQNGRWKESGTLGSQMVVSKLFPCKPQHRVYTKSIYKL